MDIAFRYGGIIAFAVLSGCATATNRTTSTAYPTDYRGMASAYLRSTLFDPYSVRDAQIAAPKLKGSFVLTDPAEGWTICVRMNAKNRMGAYTGQQETVLLIRGEKVVSSTEGPAPYYCSDAQYEPFSELGARGN